MQLMHDLGGELMPNEIQRVQQMVMNLKVPVMAMKQ
jgi:hypothetical protein